MELKKILEDADKNGNGTVDKEEFATMISEGRITHYLQFLGIDPMWSHRNMASLFDKVAVQCRRESIDGATEVDARALVERFMALRGSARSTEIIDLRDKVADVLQLQEDML